MTISKRWLVVLISLVPGCTMAPIDSPSWRSPEPVAKVHVSQPRLPPVPTVQPPFDVEPVLTSMHDPNYPDAAREAGEQGTVYCDVLVDANGRVAEVRVVAGVSPALDQAAIAAAWTAGFEPATQKKNRVAAWIRIPIEFSLRQ